MPEFLILANRSVRIHRICFTFWKKRPSGYTVPVDFAMGPFRAKKRVGEKQGVFRPSPDGKPFMIGCTRCGRWHLDAEKVAGKELSCTDVKQYWGKIREEHFQSEGHLPHIAMDDDGDWICMKCGMKLF